MVQLSPSRFISERVRSAEGRIFAGEATASRQASTNIAMVISVPSVIFLRMAASNSGSGTVRISSPSPLATAERVERLGLKT